MEVLDIKTLVFIFLTLNVLGFLAYIYMRFSILRIPGMGLWAGAHLSIALCFLFVLLYISSAEPRFLLLVIGFIMLTHVMWLSASRYFFNRDRLSPFFVFLPALIVILVAISSRAAVALQWIEDGALFRLNYTMIFTTCAFYQLAIAKEFISYRSPRLITSVSVGYAFALLAVLSILKTITVPNSLPPLVVSSSAYSITTFVMIAFIQVISMFGLVLISAERLQYKLNALAQSDPLTGLLNRRGFQLLSEQAFKRRRQGKNISMLMAFDLDHFKAINDTYGHATGDETLIAFANCLTENTRAEDIVSRVGGEEFVVLCLDVDRIDAENTAKRVSAFMAGLTMESKAGESFSITVSIGLVIIEEESPDLSCYLAAADDALYDAKAKGRNKVVMVDSSSNFSVVT
tara:strand:+ start:13550 stop:14758 length:1209 start_codon:yes stop_codon:yes gene_type:complete